MISLLKTENFVQNSSRLEGFKGKSCNLSDMCIYLNNPICFLLIFMYMCVYVCVYVERERESTVEKLSTPFLFLLSFISNKVAE